MGSKKFVKLRSASLEDLPEELMSIVFSKTSITDVLHLREVNKKFRDVGSAEFTWELMLPDNLMTFLREDSGCLEFEVGALFNHMTHVMAIMKSVKEEPIQKLLLAQDFFFDLMEHQPFGNLHDEEECWLDPSTGKIFLAISPHHPDIEIGGEMITIHRDPPKRVSLAKLSQSSLLDRCLWEWETDDPYVRDRRFWEWDNHDPYVGGTLDLRLPPGKYSFSWVLKLQKHEITDASTPYPSPTDQVTAIRTSFTDGKMFYHWELKNEEGLQWELECSSDPDRHPNLLRSEKGFMASAIESAMRPENWGIQSADLMEFEIGQFQVGEEHGRDMKCCGYTSLEFHLVYQVGNLRDHGLLFDGAVIRYLGKL